jgi:hypothetical protein
VEVWFGIIERQAIHRGSFASVRDLIIKIREFITGWNRGRHPFIWTKVRPFTSPGRGPSTGFDHCSKLAADG